MDGKERKGMKWKTVKGDSNPMEWGQNGHGNVSKLKHLLYLKFFNQKKLKSSSC
jgi:hypothetical protein